MTGSKKYRITLKMLESGAQALARCRAESSTHTPQTVCCAIFVAMIDAADVHPGPSLARSFEWSAHDTKRTAGQKRVRADFDSEGKRLAGVLNGKPYYQWINNYPYLKQYHTKRNTKS